MLLLLAWDQFRFGGSGPRGWPTHSSGQFLPKHRRLCNSLKSGMAADDFIRELYRRGRLNAVEMESRLSALAALQRGELKPITLTL